MITDPVKVKEWLDQYCLLTELPEKHGEARVPAVLTIDPDGGIHWTGDVSFENSDFLRRWTALPVKFKTVAGEFAISCAMQLTTLKGVPDNCEKLILNYLPALRVFDAEGHYDSISLFHTGIESFKPDTWTCQHLHCRCQKLTALHGLPARLKSLILRGCDSLESLAGAPADVDILDLDSLNIRTLDGSPRSCGIFTIDNCWNLTALTGISPQMMKVVLKNNKNLASLTGLPEKLQRLVVMQCPALVKWPEYSVYTNVIEWDDISEPSFDQFLACVQHRTAVNLYEYLGVPIPKQKAWIHILTQYLENNDLLAAYSAGSALYRQPIPVSIFTDTPIVPTL